MTALPLWAGGQLDQVAGSQGWVIFAFGKPRILDSSSQRRCAAQPFSAFENPAVIMGP